MARPVHRPHEASSGGWRTAILIGAVALGTFSFGHYWGREESRRDGAAVSARKDNAIGADTGGVSVSAASPDAANGKQLWTCSMHPQVILPAPGACPICHMELTPVRASAGSDSTVVVDSAIVQNMGVRTAVVSKGPLVQSVRVVGYLEEPEPLHRDINLRVSGWIEKLYANIDGMMLEKGKPLFDLYSPELTVAVDEMISARKQLATSPADETSKSMLETSKRKLLQYGLEEGQVDDLALLDAAPRTVPFLAPISAHLTAKMVNDGAAVKGGDLVLRLASRHQMWIDAQVYEQQMPLISDGQPVRATLVSEPGKVFEGKVLFVHPHVDPVTRTARVRIEIANENMHLRQGMYATVEILADNYKEALVVPREAVIDTGRRQIAFVDLGSGRFEPRELKLGQSGQEGTVQVLSGVKEGERIVTSGQFLLDSESRLREAIAKFSTPGAEKPAETPVLSKPLEEAAVPVQPALMPAVTVPQTDEIVRSYLALAKQLGERQASEAPVEVGPLVEAASRSAEQATGEARPLATAVSTTAASLRGKPIDEQRKAFIPLSDAVIALARRSRPTASVAPTLYIMNCPMAFEEKGAHWLQATETVENPYYATQMKRCGSVVEKLEGAKPSESK